MKRRIKNIKLSNYVSSPAIGSFLCVIFLSMFLNSACTPRSFDKPNNSNSVQKSSNESELSAFENDFQTMKTADLKYIFVVRRQDGNVFDADDKKYLRANLPTTNRIVLSDEEKAYIIGSNYAFPPENLELLRTRFNVEDYSSK